MKFEEHGGTGRDRRCPQSYRHTRNAEGPTQEVRQAVQKLPVNISTNTNTNINSINIRIRIAININITDSFSINSYVRTQISITNNISNMNVRTQITITNNIIGIINMSVNVKIKNKS